MALLTVRMIDRRRLRAPLDHRGILIEPAGPELRAALERNSAAGADRVRILDTTVGSLRESLRRTLELEGPLVLSGHQAEFFHAGVFAKTVVTEALARRVGGRAVFLTVDSDVVKNDRLAVPQITTGGLRRVEVATPGVRTAFPRESQPRVSREHWLEFFTRVASLLDHYDQSLLRAFSDGWLDTDETSLDFCDAMARGRAATEQALGVRDVHEIRMSRLCETQVFRAFAAHLLLHAERFARDYNAAQQAFRSRHRIRVTNRPVPPLATRDGRIELPFWIGRPGEPRRRLFVHPRGDALELLAGDDAVGALLRPRLERFKTHEQPWELQSEGWQLRPRALALSGFARLLLADLFIHGIGGAKYDEMTEDFTARFFGERPRPMGCVTATLRLPLPTHGVSRDQIIAARRQSRDIVYNPQRYLPDAPADLLQQRAELIRQATELRAARSSDRAKRRTLFNETRRSNALLLQSDPWRAAELGRQLQTLEEQWRIDHVARDREYFYALHVTGTMAELADALRSNLENN
ncbi:MAG: hypothetical protein IH986_05520 [Planctomycetes bacterium]|nr:hypothetical protein [Planctomycetota bacterium]